MKTAIYKLIGALALTTSGVAEAQLQYVTNADGTSVTITGYAGSAPSALVIPSNFGGLAVTGIAAGAFEDFTDLSSVVIPNSVTSLGNGAFANTSLTNVSIPDSITNIPEDAFTDCLSLTTVSIPDSVVSIGYQAISGGGLTSITIPGSVTNIGYAAIASCQNLTNVIIGFGVPYIGTNMFTGSPMVSVTIPASVTNIDEGGFAGCLQLTNVFFTGNAPGVPNPSVFDNTAFNGRQSSNYFSATAYYLPGTTGWAEFSSNSMIPAVLWSPVIQASGASFGVQSNQFGFDITGTTNIPIVVEACGNLAQPIWVPLQSMTLTNGLVHFSEPVDTNTAARFYRIGAP